MTAIAVAPDPMLESLIVKADPPVLVEMLLDAEISEQLVIDRSPDQFAKANKLPLVAFNKQLSIVMSAVPATAELKMLVADDNWHCDIAMSPAAGGTWTPIIATSSELAPCIFIPVAKVRFSVYVPALTNIVVVTPSATA